MFGRKKHLAKLKSHAENQEQQFLEAAQNVFLYEKNTSTDILKSSYTLKFRYENLLALSKIKQHPSKRDVEAVNVGLQVLKQELDWVKRAWERYENFKNTGKEFR